jgi:hypothetical protein
MALMSLLGINRRRKGAVGVLSSPLFAPPSICQPYRPAVPPQNPIFLEIFGPFGKIISFLGNITKKGNYQKRKIT